MYYSDLYQHGHARTIVQYIMYYNDLYKYTNIACLTKTLHMV
jgi:hypothetical protein